MLFLIAFLIVAVSAENSTLSENLCPTIGSSSGPGPYCYLCYCGGGGGIGPMLSTSVEESLADKYAPEGTEVATFTQLAIGKTYFCNGGCWGSVFKSTVVPNVYVKTITVWNGGQCGNFPGKTNIQKMCWTLTNGDKTCVGGDRVAACRSGLGPASSYTFEDGETLQSLIIGNGEYGRSYSGRVVYLKWSTLKADGTAGNFEAGDKTEAYHNYYEGLNVSGKVMAGFFGKALYDLNQLGFFIATPVCPITKRVITDIKCKTPKGALCESTWASTGHMMSVKANCNSCDVTGISPACSFPFSWTTSNTVTVTSTSINALNVGAGASITYGVEASEGLFFSGVKESVSGTFHVDIGYTHTWEKAKSYTTSYSNTVGSTCSLTIPPGKSYWASGMLHLGTMKADLTMTVTSYTSCGGKTEKAHQATVTVDNVPGIGAIEGCTFSDGVCPSQELGAPVAQASFSGLANALKSIA